LSRRKTTKFWEIAIEKRLAERQELMPLLHTTVYGPFNPTSEKSKLKRLVIMLSDYGFTNTDIIGSTNRPNLNGLDRHEISKFYLEESDVNLLVFTLEGSYQGLITEFDMITSFNMRDKWDTCIICYEKKNKKKALGSLQLDRLKQINIGRTRIVVIPFSNFELFLGEIQNHVFNEYKFLGPVLKDRS